MGTLGMLKMQEGCCNPVLLARLWGRPMEKGVEIVLCLLEHRDVTPWCTVGQSPGQQKSHT